MVSVGVIIGISILVLLFITGVTVGIIFLLRRLKTVDVPPNSPIGISFTPHRSQGYVVGVETDLKGDPHSDNALVMMKPLDLKYDKDGQPIQQEEINFAISKSKRIALSKGTLSEHRDIVLYLPERASDLPRKLLQDSIIGQAIMLSTEVINIRDSAIEAIKAGDQAKVKIIRELNTGELSEDLVKYVKGIQDELIRKPVEKEMAEQEKNKLSRKTN